MSTNETRFRQIIEKSPDLAPGNLFGKPCGKVGKKAVVAFFEEEMVFKVGKTEVDHMLTQYEGAQRFDPSRKGRPMKDWVQVPDVHKADWEILTQKAIDFLKNNPS